MPTSRFSDLAPDKRSRIINVSIAEFSRYGYENSSTNRIIAHSGISKGSLFKYFDSKEELYLYVLDVAASEMISDLVEGAQSLSTDLFKMVVEYSILEFSWYAEHPEKAGLIIRAFSPSDTAISRKVAKKYSGRDDDLFYRLLESIDGSPFRYDRQKTMDIVKWFLKGFNEEFLERIQYGEALDIDAIKNEYTATLTAHMAILRSALVK